MNSRLLADLPAPPPDSPATGERWRESAKRYAMLSGSWYAYLREEFVRWFPNSQTQAQIGRVDTTKNMARGVISQLSTLYDEEPHVLHDDVEAAQAMAKLCDEAGLWQLQRMHQQYVIGQREGAVRVFCDYLGRVRFRQVPAHLLHAVARPDNPDEPVTIYEYRPRRVGKDVIWTRELWDVSDPGFPQWRIENEQGVNITREIAGSAGLVGLAYPYRDDNGVPVLPYGFYHAQRTGRLFDAFYGSELFQGSLMVAVLWSFWSSIVRDSSWPQRYAVDVHIGGTTVDNRDPSGGPYVALNPAALLQMQRRADGTPQIGQWAPGGDPLTLGDAIRAYASDLAVEFDVSPADVSRRHADARSGYAIEITRDGQRHAQRRYLPGFRRADRFLLAVTAAVAKAHGVAGAEALPTSGYDLHYPGLPLSLEERRVQAEENAALQSQGLASPVQLYAKIYGVSEEEARIKLRQIKRDLFEFSAEYNLIASRRLASEENKALQDQGVISAVQLYAKIYGVSEAEARAKVAEVAADRDRFEDEA